MDRQSGGQHRRMSKKSLSARIEEARKSKATELDLSGEGLSQSLNLSRFVGAQRTWDQMLDIDLQRWTPVRVWDMRCHQCTPSSNSMTLESNMSQDGFAKQEDVP